VFTLKRNTKWRQQKQHEIASHDTTTYLYETVVVRRLQRQADECVHVFLKATLRSASVLADAAQQLDAAVA
jgi:hypothetical protein